MQDYERAFVDKMAGLALSGVSFARAIEAGVKEKLGEVPGEVFLRSLSRAARVDPHQFVKESARLFGRGAIGIYAAIERQGATPLRIEEPSRYESAMEELLEGIGGTPVVRVIPPADRQLDRSKLVPR